ncbi:hypothetical protein [Emcibacter sp.]|uniref:hypothetical protein n=1 Tax=Emcibacter sp. TaxID=1979954 RepID=UPI002AA7374F|nr:hypothetical protein [Emcibacter sp.]
MIIGRLLGYLCLAFALLVTGADLLRILEIRQVDLLSLAELWALVGESSLMSLEDLVVSGRFPGVWQDVILPFLAIPATIFFIVLGVLFLFSCRKRYLA